jgi:hypothetical protein
MATNTAILFVLLLAALENWVQRFAGEEYLSVNSLARVIRMGCLRRGLAAGEF